MRKVDTLVLNDKEIQVKELTVMEVRHWLMDMLALEKQSQSEDTVGVVLDQGLFDGIALSDILRMSSLSQDEVNNLTPSELKIVADKCKELNPDFFQMRVRLLTQVSENA